MNYYGNRHNETYTYKRVAWENWTEHENYGYITGGSLELSTDSDMFVSGNFTFEGLELPDTTDLMRVYYSFTDDDGEAVSLPLATFCVTYAGLTYEDSTSGMVASGTINGISILSILKEKIYGAPFTVTRNSNAIYKAQDLIKQVGLNVEYTPSVKVLSADHTFPVGASYLDIVTWLCNEAGYTAPYPDAYGTIQLQPLADTLGGESVATFKNDDDSIMYPELEEANDWQSTPNVVKLFYNTDLACITAKAENVSGSMASLDARGGREQTYFEEIGELDDDGNRLTTLLDRAEELLRKLSCDVEYITLKHAYIPLYPYQQITVNYSEMEWIGTIENMTIELAPSTVTQTKIKRELYDVIEVEKSGEVLRGTE